MKLDKLNQRERYAISLACAFIGIFVIVQFIVYPFMDRKERIARQLKLKETQFEQIQSMKSEYDMLRESSLKWEKLLRKRPRGFKLFPFMDNLAKTAKVNGNIDYMKPSSSKPKNSPYTLSRVELKLKEINTRQLTDYLHLIEFSENMVVIRRLSITKKGKEGFIDVVLQVETFEA
ncbi:general secretion pathway protein GspM [Desulfonema ishimotonii]|uniref:General secretion pathway protein GspM n=1 Tax=Desulfonema ishimotonii TaxID=45657 RepID=A0A401G4B2_9BACT|nr:hypothetical protein [Desulfonema ishimotonii]GBC64060.1 general secretion pathway protein GspM [Desulfonema ishimotonii]